MTAKAAFQNGTLAIYINHEDLEALLYHGFLIVPQIFEGEEIPDCMLQVNPSPEALHYLRTVYDAEAEAYYQARVNRPKGKPGRKKGGHNRPKEYHGEI